MRPLRHQLGWHYNTTARCCRDDTRGKSELVPRPKIYHPTAEGQRHQQTIATTDWHNGFQKERKSISKAMQKPATPRKSCAEAHKRHAKARKGQAACKMLHTPVKPPANLRKSRQTHVEVMWEFGVAARQPTQSNCGYVVVHCSNRSNRLRTNSSTAVDCQCGVIFPSYEVSICTSVSRVIPEIRLTILLSSV